MKNIWRLIACVYDNSLQIDSTLFRSNFVDDHLLSIRSECDSSGMLYLVASLEQILEDIIISVDPSLLLVPRA